MVPEGEAGTTLPPINHRARALVDRTYARGVARVLITGMSGAGKSTVLGRLAERGHLTVDTDYDDWTLPDATWDEPRMAALLAGHRPWP